MSSEVDFESHNNRCPASFAALTTQNTARVASRVGHLER